MKKYSWLWVLVFFWGSPVWASPELVQVVTFTWDEETQALEALSLGSGTVIRPNLILTNKHVVEDEEGETADFVLLCLSGNRSTQPVACDIPGAVTSLHEKYDAALIRPLYDRVYFPSIRTSSHLLQSGDRIRVEGFPIPVGHLQNFGDQKTLKNIQAWVKDGGSLETAGDNLTVTRGEVRAAGILEKTGALYYLTDVKVNFGNSGGAAFNEHRDFIGIPTLRDTEYNALILEYRQLLPWILEREQIKPQVDKVVLDAYVLKRHEPERKDRHQENIRKQIRRVRASVFNESPTQKTSPRHQRTWRRSSSAWYNREDRSPQIKNNHDTRLRRRTFSRRFIR